MSNLSLDLFVPSHGLCSLRAAKCHREAVKVTQDKIYFNMDWSSDGQLVMDESFRAAAF